MAASRNQPPQKPVTMPVLAASIALTGYGLYLGYPGLAALWLGLVVCAFTAPPAIFTGKKDSRGYSTPAHEGEQAAMNKYRFWEDLKVRLLMPNTDWLPGWWPLLSWFAAVLAGAAAYFIPVVDIPVTSTYTLTWGDWINAAAAFIVTTQVTGSRRRTMVPGDMNPGARLDTMIKLAKTDTAKFAALAGGGAALGGALAVGAVIFEPVWGRFIHIPAWALFAILIPAGILTVTARTVIDAALEHWRIVVAARAEWEPRWAMLKMDPAPRLIDRKAAGPATVDTFEAPGSVGAMAFWQLAPKIEPTIGAGTEVYTLDVPNTDTNGQPVPGSRHPLRFDVVVWPADQKPDVTDPAADQDAVTQLARCALAKACDEGSLSPRYIFDEIHLLTEPAPAANPAASKPTSVEGQIVPYKKDDAEEAPEPQQQQSGSPAVWALTWYHPDGAAASDFRTRSGGALGAALNVPAAVDHRALGGDGLAYFGAIGDPSVVYTPQSGVTATTIDNIAAEDQWNARWGEAESKIKVNPPVPQFETAQEAELENGVVINKLAFVTRQGMEPSMFFNIEPALPTVLNAAPFVSVTGWPGSGGRPGERHAQAICVYWSDRSVPSRPDELVPVRGSEAPKWVLAGRINQAFKAAKLARPELVRATALTRADSRGHIWKIELRLHGGVTLAEVRGAARKIRESWASEWLRISDAPDGCILYAGAKPSKVKLANPRFEKELHALDWQQSWLDAKVTGIGGLLPKLVSVDHMPRNQQVKILTFDLEGTGLDYAKLREARATLESTSGHSFVDVRKIKNTSTQVQVLASEVNPMPEHAPYDYDAINDAKGIPFATGVEGEPVEFNLKDHIHLLVVGGSGSGKSVILQSLITGAFRRGCDLYIADPTKGAADFTFAEPYAKAFCKDLLSTGGMMKGVYAEVKRRVALNTAHGVGSYRDLPEDVRPGHIVIVLDEFTSLIAPDAVAKPSDDPEIEAEREMAQAINAAKAEIGAFTAKIAREARSAGITLLLATQKLTQKDLDQMPGGSTLKVNLSRLIAGKSTFGERMSALKDAQNAPELGDSIPPGRAIFEPVTSGPVLIQCWYDKREQEALSLYLGMHRDVLDDEEKLDLSQYMRRLPNQEPIEDAEPTVIDLGEMELDLGDLELSWDDLEEESYPADGEAGTTEEAAESDSGADPDSSGISSDEDFWPEGDDEVQEAPHVSEAQEYVHGTVLFTDIDGTIFPFAHGDGMIRMNVPGHGTVAYRPEVTAGLSRLAAHQVWLSDWSEDAPNELGALFPHTREVLDADTDVYGWWKIDAAEAWLKANPGVRRVIWADDDLDSEDDLLGVPMSGIAGELFDDMGVEHLLLAPDPVKGLSDLDLARMADFSAGGDGAAALPATAPQDPSERPEAVEEEPPPAPVNSAPETVPDAEEDPFADAPAPAAPVPDDDEEDPFADIPAPRRIMVPDDEDPFA